jgi:hypothetical protein
LPNVFSASDFSSANTDFVGDEWLRGIFRINTNLSAGDESFSIVFDKAKGANLDFIVVSDQFLVRAEYGIWPFRRIFSYAVKRKSVVEFGVKRYLSLINEEDLARNDLVLIPGVDVAPHYFWSGFPFTRNFRLRQFSKQLTVFGPASSNFYQNLPVIHNEVNDFSRNSILKMFPLLFVIWGVVLLFHLKIDKYKNSSGELLSWRINRFRLFLALCFILLGVCWTLNNRPFSHHLGLDQYSERGNLPYQKLIDYVRNNGCDDAGVLWSAPEASTRITIMKTTLDTSSYLPDVLSTFGHNGMAGLYGDAITALRPGGEWDMMLLEYCSGKRHVRPIVVGELDYHGRKRRIDMYQTIVRGAKKNRSSIFNAIIEGRSYAYAKLSDSGLELIDASLSCNGNVAKLGDTLYVEKNTKKLTVNLSFKLTGESVAEKKGEIQITLNGKLLKKEKFKGTQYNCNFSIDLASFIKEKKNLGYIRFDITARGARIVTNPIFWTLLKER